MWRLLTWKMCVGAKCFPTAFPSTMDSDADRSKRRKIIHFGVHSAEQVRVQQRPNKRDHRYMTNTTKCFDACNFWCISINCPCEISNLILSKIRVFVPQTIKIWGPFVDLYACAGATTNECQQNQAILAKRSGLCFATRTLLYAVPCIEH